MEFEGIPHAQQKGGGGCPDPYRTPAPYPTLTLEL